ncbi:hypothetical protein EGW08_015398 [Elysia chlorotica]|uniref:Galectin domain-containing protein n=1 Tax=Elysia chlorotica TaxID=188477 RepID=A0A3S1BWQ0_ELYCH|nr:hypothetical protein EGW08_015398 [Elysia chlorotica]
MARIRLSAVVALGLFLSTENPHFLSFLPGILKVLSSSAVTRSHLYSHWPGRLEGCEFKPSPSNSMLDCAMTAARGGYPVLKFNSSSGLCLLSLAQNVSGYSPAADDFFFLQRSNVWWSSTFRGGIRMDNGIRPGQVFEVFGQVPPVVDNFTVFWKPTTVWETTEDLAFKTVFSFSQTDISQNLLIKSKVDGVSRKKNILFGDPVLKVGESFRMFVLITTLKYVVYIHDQYCCSLNHDFTNLSAIHYLFVNDNPVVQYIIF